MMRSILSIVTAALVAAVTAGPAAAAPVPAPAGGYCDNPRDVVPIQISTVPAAPNMVIHMDGQPLQLSAEGTAAPVSCRRELISRIEVARDAYQIDERRQVRFDRIFVSDAGRKVELAFHTDYLTQIRLNGLPAEDIDSYTIQSSTGERITSVGNDPLWLWGQRVVRGPSGLVTRPLFYSVQEVLVHGENVVTRSKTKFEPVSVPVVEVPLLSYTVNLQVRDRLFGFPLGSTAYLEAKDGTVVTLPLEGGAASVESLPRGTYTLSVDAPGLDTPRPISVSRDQVVDLPVLSWVDLAVLLGLPGLIAALLVLGPRPALRARLRRATGIELLRNRIAARKAVRPEAITTDRWYSKGGTSGTADPAWRYVLQRRPRRTENGAPGDDAGLDEHTELDLPAPPYTEGSDESSRALRR